MATSQLSVNAGRGPISHLIMSCILVLCLVMAACASVKELHSQEELSDVAGVFAASRYLVYQSSDDRYHYFKEKSKFGPYGPSGEFRILKKHLPLVAPVPDSVFTYDQNAGVFRLRGTVNGQVIKADFTEKYTLEEEEYLKAVTALAPLKDAAPSEKKGQALHRAMRWSFHAGHFEDAERYGLELLALVPQLPVKDQAHGEAHEHIAHTFMGLMAIDRNDLPKAKQHLLASAAESAPTPTLTSFGPNMSLAKALAQRGQWEVVAQYLTLCERFWPRDELRAWRRQIERRRVPDFGANLSYGL